MKTNLNAAPANKAVVRRLYEDCFNRGKLNAADELVSPDFVSLGSGGGSGLDGFKANATRLLTGFPDVQFTIRDLIAENDRVAVYWTWEGTHRGIFANIPPTGKRVQQEGMVAYRLEGGKVMDARVIFDRLGVFQQLGMAAELPGAPKTSEPPKA